MHIFYQCLTGSQAYGTAIEGSDKDYVGIAFADPEKYLGGFSNFESEVRKVDGNDSTIHEIQKFCSLAADANPNILEPLFCDPSDVLLFSQAADVLRANRDLFLSKKVRYTYTGYAFSQLKRIRSHRHWLLHPPTKRPERKDFGLPEWKISVDQQEAFIHVIARLLEGSVEELNLSAETRDELSKVNYLGLLQSKIPADLVEPLQKISGSDEDFIERLALEKGYQSAVREWESFLSWKENRNLKRAELERKFGFDCKHASHTIRLLRTGKEILQGKGLLVRRPDAEELIAIRQGAWTFDQIEEYAAKEEAEIAALYQTSTLPAKPDRKKIEEICMNLVWNHLSEVNKES